MKVLLKSDKKWTLKIQKSKIVILVLNQSPISAVFQKVQLPWGRKTALNGESQYRSLSFHYVFSSKIIHNGYFHSTTYDDKN